MEDNTKAITQMCESIMLRELKILYNTSHADTLEDKACNRLVAVAEVLRAVNTFQNSNPKYREREI